MFVNIVGIAIPPKFVNPTPQVKNVPTNGPVKQRIHWFVTKSHIYLGVIIAELCIVNEILHAMFVQYYSLLIKPFFINGVVFVLLFSVNSYYVTAILQTIFSLKF